MLSSVELVALVAEVWERLFLYLVQVNCIAGLIIASSTKAVSTFIVFKLEF